MEINFSHGFHNTNITVYAKGGELTSRQIKKVEKKLCGMADCSCPMYPIYGITANEATADSCAVCAAVGGYCGNCDGSYWKANSYSK